MSEFKREPRYVVFKIKDIEKYLTQGEKDSLMCIGDEIACARADDGKPPFNAVVVEQDWPEFEMVWDAIEARMTANVEFSGTPAASSPEAPLERRVGGAVPPAPTFEKKGYGNENAA